MKTFHLFCFASLLWITGCRPQEATPVTEEIKNKLVRFYTQEESFYYLKPDSNVLSDNLISRIYAAQEATRQDEERIRNSDSPTDKPLMLEGSVFSGLYDGYSQYNIGKITLTPTKAAVLVHFELAGEPKEVWTDTVQFIRENGWKIDNVQFSNKVSTATDLKEKLDFKNE